MTPRPLTREARRELGLPDVATTPYRWSFVLLLVALASAPLLVAGFPRVAAALAVVALLVVPGLRAMERRERQRRERIYTHGDEALGHILAVEPGSDRNRDRIVRLELWAGGRRYETAVHGCRLARKGLEPGEEVRLLVDPTDPTRCLIVDRAKREIIDAS